MTVTVSHSRAFVSRSGAAKKTSSNSNISDDENSDGDGEDNSLTVILDSTIDDEDTDNDTNVPGNCQYDGCNGKRANVSRCWRWDEK